MGNRNARPDRACYFSTTKPLQFGSYGGEVFCLQQYLCSQGLMVEPSGYYGEKTLAAVEKWQCKHRVKDQPGVFGEESKGAYARALRIPTLGGPSSKEELEASKPVHSMEVCSELNNRKYCECAYSRSAQEMPHACAKACQLTFSKACSQAYRPLKREDSASDFRKCMQFMPSSCEATCTALHRSPS